MFKRDTIRELSDAVVIGDEEKAEQVARKALETGLNPLEVMEKGVRQAMEITGKKFENREYFVIEMLLSARAAETAMKILKAKLKTKPSQKKGTVVFGTVLGDIHSIGKMMVITNLEMAGFEVYDLGVDVPGEKFVEKAREVKADIVCLSALVTTTMMEMENVVNGFKEAGLRDKVKILIGGAPVSKAFAEQIGADAYAADCVQAVKVAKELMKRR